jgi:hypothetical protein
MGPQPHVVKERKISDRTGIETELGMCVTYYPYFEKKIELK